MSARVCLTLSSIILLLGACLLGFGCAEHAEKRRVEHPKRSSLSLRNAPRAEVPSQVKRIKERHERRLSGLTEDSPQFASARTIAQVAEIEIQKQSAMEGVGLVVGLSGKGSQEVPAELRREFLRQLVAAGFSYPERLIRSRSTATVIVAAKIPSTATVGSHVDVVVQAMHPGVNLSGGRLLRTALQPVIGVTQSGKKIYSSTYAFAGGAVSAEKLQWGGVVYPPARPGRGYVLDGARVSRRPAVTLKLGVKDARLARKIKLSIETRFPGSARLVSASKLGLTVPKAYEFDRKRFGRVVEKLYLGQIAAEEINKKIRQSTDKLISEKVSTRSKREAALAMEAIGDQAVNSLLEVLERGDARGRLESIVTLSYLANMSSVRLLVSAVEDPLPAIRAAAADALGRIGDNVSVPYIEGLLADSDLDVRYRAVLALESLGRSSLVFTKRGKVVTLTVVSLPGKAGDVVVISRYPRQQVILFGRFPLGKMELRRSGLQFSIEEDGEIGRISKTNEDSIGSVGVKPTLADAISAVQSADGSFADIVALLNAAQKAEAIQAQILWK